MMTLTLTGLKERQTMKIKWWMCLFFLLASGCAGSGNFLNTKLNTPPEFNQKILLQVPDDYTMFQAPRSVYDPGDLQSFHTQHTLPIVIEDAFQEMFGDVQMVEDGPRIEMGAPDVPAVFEVRIMDLSHDIYNEATSYRAKVKLAVAMKSPGGDIYWQDVFGGNGYVMVNPQFDIGHTGPGDAILDAMRDAINQMQRAIIASPEVRLQMQHYQAISAARKEKEKKV